VTGRPLRADAARNRVALLGAARGAFAEHGSAIGAAELVRHAGVSKAALFRHFKTKRELLLAVLTGDLRDLLDRLAQAAELADAADAFRAFMVEGAGDMVQRRALLEATTTDMLDEPEMRPLLHELHALCEHVLARAQHAGLVRDEITGADLMVVLKAPAATVLYLEQVHPEIWRRYLDILLDGMRPEGARPLSTPAPDPTIMPGLRPAPTGGEVPR
jgi:AcrR family transcriptional regulator